MPVVAINPGALGRWKKDLTPTIPRPPRGPNLDLASSSTLAVIAAKEKDKVQLREREFEDVSERVGIVKHW